MSSLFEVFSHFWFPYDLAHFEGMSTSFSDSNLGRFVASVSGRVLEVFKASSSRKLFEFFIETQEECWEDTPEEHAETLWLRRVRCEWVNEGVRITLSKYKWSRLLKSWLNYIYIFKRGLIWVLCLFKGQVV